MPYKQVGGGSWGVFKRDEPPVWPWVLIGLVLLIACFG